MVLAAAEVPVALNGVEKEPGVTESALAPAVVPSFQLPTAARPFASVVWLAPATLPPPPATANVTAALGTPLPYWSASLAEGDVATAVLTVALWPSPPAFVIAAAGPGTPVAVKVTGLPIRDPDVAVRLVAPAVVPSVHDVTRARPLASVVTAVVGLTVPPPDASADAPLTPG